MPDFLILRFEAPLMSFGGPTVDSRGVIQAWPARSMLTGLIANALGWHHRDVEKIESLQERLRYVVRADKRGRVFQDYQTIDLSQDFLDGSRGWTTMNRLQQRAGGNSSGTHIRTQDFLADAAYTLAVSVTDGLPGLEEIEAALIKPARPLFIGRKTCIPSVPIFQERVSASNPIEALKSSRLKAGKCLVWLDDDGGEGRRFAATDGRDWKNQTHSQQRWLVERMVDFGGGI